MNYLKFRAPRTFKEKGEQSRVSEILIRSTIKAIERTLPQANPDYDDQIDDVRTWLIEIVDESDFPNREIGLDNDGKAIMILPNEDNYGYWTDNNLKLKDFRENFEIEEIGKEEFDRLWNDFKRKRKY